MFQHFVLLTDFFVSDTNKQDINLQFFPDILYLLLLSYLMKPILSNIRSRVHELEHRFTQPDIMLNLEIIYI